ncbi:MAG: ABC transporter permease, partial [Pseudomonadota bacterium]
MPLMTLFLFGYALSLDVDRIPTLVLDLDHTPSSRNFIRKMGDSRYFDLIKFLDREAEIEASLDRSEGLVAVV